VSLRARLSALIAIVLVATLGAVGYVLYERHRQDQARASAPPVATIADVKAVVAEPHLVFRSTALGTGYGTVAVVPLSAPDGPRAFTPAQCERIYATRQDAICLTAERGLVTSYQARLLNADWSARRDLPLQGVPSRARLSRDGSLVATTTFVFGDSYANPGQFSTRTIVSRIQGEVVGDIEKFALIVRGRTVTSQDKNFWGVTFADDDAFYATAASGGKTWLVRGALSTGRVTALREDVECPSLSPDRTRIAFKKHGSLPAGRWRLAVYDLASGKETLLAETHSVDDQVEWLDDQRILYGLPRSASNGAATSDIWVTPADGSGTPEVFVRDAWSPAVVR
jgi:hypothetical protein